jgi:hypothetical protein
MNTTRIIVLGLVLLLPVRVIARIGETPAQCEARYGKPIKSFESTDSIGFRKAGLSVLVGFHEGKADMIVYEKDATDTSGESNKMSDNEIETLLNANGGDKKWKNMNTISMSPDVSVVIKRWETEDGALIAEYEVLRNMLIVSTKERKEREQKSKEEKKLEGF